LWRHSRLTTPVQPKAGAPRGGGFGQVGPISPIVKVPAPIAGDGTGLTRSVDTQRR